MTFKKSALAIIALVLTTTTAHAQNSLTANTVRAHMYEENRLLQSLRGNSNLQAVQDFLRKHLASNFVYKDTVTSTMGAYGSTTENIEHSKMDYIDNIMNNADMFDGINNDLNIQTIDVSADGKRATVVYSTAAKFDAKNADLAKRGGSKSTTFGFDTNSACRSNMLLNEQVIQTERLVCKTNAKMTLPDGFGE